MSNRVGAKKPDPAASSVTASSAVGAVQAARPAAVHELELRQLRHGGHDRGAALRGSPRPSVTASTRSRGPAAACRAAGRRGRRCGPRRPSGRPASAAGARRISRANAAACCGVRIGERFGPDLHPAAQRPPAHVQLHRDPDRTVAGAGGAPRSGRGARPSRPSARAPCRALVGEPRELGDRGAVRGRIADHEVVEAVPAPATATRAGCRSAAPGSPGRGPGSAPARAGSAPTSTPPGSACRRRAGACRPSWPTSRRGRRARTEPRCPRWRAPTARNHSEKPGGVTVVAIDLSLPCRARPAGPPREPPQICGKLLESRAAESLSRQATGAGDPGGGRRPSGANRRLMRSATPSVRARQLTPQAQKEHGPGPRTSPCGIARVASRGW